MPTTWRAHIPSPPQARLDNRPKGWFVTSPRTAARRFGGPQGYFDECGDVYGVRRVRNGAGRAREEAAQNVPKEEQSNDDGDCEEAEQDRVLGRRLAILPLPQLGCSDLQPHDGSHQEFVHGRVLLGEGGVGGRPGLTVAPIFGSSSHSFNGPNGGLLPDYRGRPTSAIVTII